MQFNIYIKFIFGQHLQTPLSLHGYDSLRFRGLYLYLINCLIISLNHFVSTHRNVNSIGGRTQKQQSCIQWIPSLLGYCFSLLRALRMAARSQDLAVEKTQADGAPCVYTHTHTPPGGPSILMWSGPAEWITPTLISRDSQWPALCVSVCLCVYVQVCVEHLSSITTIY